MTSAKQVVKHIGRVMVGVLVFNAVSPLSVLAREKGAVDPTAQRQLQQYAALNQRIEQAKVDKALGPAERTARDFRETQDLVHSLLSDARSGHAGASASSPTQTRALGPNMRIEVQRPVKLSEARRSEQRGQLKQHLQAIHDGQDSARAEFAATGQRLQDKKLPAQILARQQAAVAQFEQRAAEFERLSQAWLADGNEVALAQLDEFFKRYPAHREAAPFDPKKLPWSTPKPTTREPAATRTAWFQNLWGHENVRLAQATSVGPINFQVPPEPGQSPDAGDLAETPETQQSAAIKAKAVELGNNPVAIHNWVRNNVEWVPTWGAIQSAEDTLNKKRGNAHDTASLEIALLRAANIPARYQYGTIEITAEQAQNWVGGVNVPQAAQQLMGQGGIANKALVSGGKIAKIQLEHVWVQAYVNWAPSRGAKQGSASQHVNPNGPLNAWVSLDPSFKQYTYSAGMDLKTNVPLDANALITAAQQGATVNQAEGWVQNLNQVAIQGQLADYQSRLQTYINSQNATATTADVIGKNIIPVDLTPMLAGSMPYAVVQQSAPVQAVPASLQHKFTYKLYASQYDRDTDSPLLSYTEKTSQLVGKRLTISYVPASQADADTIASYMPKPHADGTPIQANELPASLPAYLIHLKPQIVLEGKVVADAGQGLIMGTDLYSTGGFTQLYDTAQWDLTSEETNTVGNATTIGLSIAGISQSQLTWVKARLTQTQLAIADPTSTTDPTAVSSTRVSEDLLAAVLWSWFAVVESSSQLTQLQTGVLEYPGLSYGLFHGLVNPVTSWGVIRSVTFPGVNMDIGHERFQTWALNGGMQEWINHNRVRGQYMSTLEATVPERFFNQANECNAAGTTNPDPGLPACNQGVSATRALAFGAMQGQKIYTITQSVYANSPTLIDGALAAQSAAVRDKARQALDAGYEVSVHEKPIAQGGFVGAGIVIIDPSTGAGAYLLDGSNGGSVDTVADKVFVMLGLAQDVAVQAAQQTVTAATAAVTGAYMALQGAFSCVSQTTVNIIILALVVAAVVAAIILGGPAIGAAIAALLAILAPTSAFAAQDSTCPAAICSAERAECFGTSLNDAVGGSPGSGRCQLCYESCMQLDGHWPSRSHTGDRCDYWNFK